MTTNRRPWLDLAFNLGAPEQPPAVSGIDVALVHDGRIARLHTMLTSER